MKYLIWKIIGIILGFALIVVGYIYWEDIKVGAKNAFEWVNEVREEREYKKREKATNDSILTGGGFEE